MPEGLRIALLGSVGQVHADAATIFRPALLLHANVPTTLNSG